MEQVQGSSPFDLSSIINLRVRFVNRSGDSVPQHIYFFDLESLSLPPAPVVGTLTLGAANTVVIQFTSADDAGTGSFGLQTRSALDGSGSWTADNAATIQSLGGGKYQATTTRVGPAQFYRVSRF